LSLQINVYKILEYFRLLYGMFLTDTSNNVVKKESRNNAMFM